MTKSLPGYRIVGTAGHIDHGKSALVKALSGTDPDRLQEEQERGITIDLGFAETRLADTRVAFIDVPGHERFVKNMLAGIGGIDAVLLVVAADESVMPQTREHLAICSLLGITHGVVAVTKCDLADAELQELVELEVHELLEGTPLSEATVVRTSAATGDGLEDLRDALANCLAATPERHEDDPLRLPVDRAFSVKGFGTVVTGTLMSGAVSVGDTVELFPSGRRLAVRGVQVHGEATSSALAGQRTALNLQSIAVEQIARGDTIIEPGSSGLSHMLDVHLEVLPGFEIEQLQRVRFHHGSAEILGRVAVLSGDTLPAGESGYAQIRLESPCSARPGDRFILRRYSPLETIAGGEVIDVSPAKHRRATLDLDAIREFHRADDPGRVAWLVRRAGVAGTSEAELALRIGRSAAATRAALHLAAESGEVTLVSESPLLAVTAADFAELQKAVVAAARAYHDRFPLRPAVPKEELRAAAGKDVGNEVLEAALNELTAADTLRRDAEGHALSTHISRIPDNAVELGATIVSRFARAGLAPPTIDDALDGPGAADSIPASELLHYLLRRGELVRVRDDLVFHAEAIAKLIDAMQDQFPRGQQFSVGDFKDWARVSRKYAIPLLEYLDAQRITRRVGDSRERI